MRGTRLRKIAIHIEKVKSVHDYAVADPGFPVGGRRPRRGGANSRGGYVSKNLYVKMKESGPVGGGTGGTPLWIHHNDINYSRSIKRSLLLDFNCEFNFSVYFMHIEYDSS